MPQSEVRQLRARGVLLAVGQKQGFTVQHESKSHFSHSTFSRCNRALRSFLNAAALCLNWSGSECAANTNVTYLNLLVALSTWGRPHTQRSAQILKQNGDSEGFCGGMLGNKTWQPFPKCASWAGGLGRPGVQTCPVSGRPCCFHVGNASFSGVKDGGCTEPQASQHVRSCLFNLYKNWSVNTKAGQASNIVPIKQWIVFMRKQDN